MKEKLNLPGEIVVFSNERIGKEIVKGEDVNCKGIYFDKCAFEGDLIFKNVDLNCGVVFFNECISNNIIHFSTCVSKNTDRGLTEFDTSNLLIKNSTFNNLIIDKQSEFNFGVRIIDGTELQELNISRLFSEQGSIYINESTIHKSLNFKNSKVASGIRLNRSTLGGTVRYENIIGSSFSFTKSHIKGNVFLWGGNISTITFNEGIYDDDFHIDAVKCNGLLTSIGDQFKKGIQIKYIHEPNDLKGGPKKYHIQSLTCNGIFEIIGSENSAVPFPIEEIKIISSFALSGQIIIKNIASNNLDISGTIKDVDILFDYCQFKEIKIDNLINSGSLRFQNIKAIKGNSSFLIKNSNLGKAYFFNFFFNTFSEVRVYDTILSDIFTSRVRWFENLNKTKDAQIDLNQVRDIFRQLKLSMEKQGDKINSSYFKKREMEIHYRSLNFKNNTGDLLMMWLNKSNNYGMSWIKPVIILLLIALPVLWLMIFLTSEELRLQPATSYEDLVYCINLFLMNINLYPQLLNPLNSLGNLFIDNNGVSFWFYSVSFIWKITVAYFVFQTVTAFRKYVK